MSTWWQDGVVYQIYPRSFCDTTGNGIGDLEGIGRHLDHLVDLGVDAIWLSPIFPSPMADHGYDVADYCDIDPMFGDLDAFDRLLAEAHGRDLRVILDWVPNHTSEAHPWFVESRSSRDNPKRDWYLWHDGDGVGEVPPNNWRAVFPEGSAWKWDPPTESWYLHLFTPEQPDLNWRNPEVRAAMGDTLRFWLDRGVDGFRMDVIHLLAKDPAFGDVEPGSSLFAAVLDADATHEYLREIRGVLDTYDDVTSVGEVYILDTHEVVDYLGSDAGEELHLAFNFMPLHQPWDAERWRTQIRIAEDAFGARDRWPTWVLSNHDVVRHRSRYGESEERARAAAFLPLTLRGTPFLYAGEELGASDADVPPEMRQDPSGTRDGCRAPIPWTADAPHGWATAAPWLPFPPEASLRNPEAEGDDVDSVLSLYRRLLRERRASAALHAGSLELLDDLPAGVVGWTRTAGDDVRTVLVNMGEGPATVSGFDGQTVVVAGHLDDEGEAFDGLLRADHAVVLA